jgi:hypothetical protein
MYPAVIKVTALEDFILEVVFDNGQEGQLDMKPYLDLGVFRRLREPGAFQAVKTPFDTVEWDCGVDLDPEFLYAEMTRHVAPG